MSNLIDKERQEKLVLENLGLVHHTMKSLKIAKSDYDDIASVGAIGLIKAAQTFNESKNIKFATYAIKCIRNEILMHFRRQKRHANNISLDEPISSNDFNNEITLGDTISISGQQEWDEQIEAKESFSRIMSIVLNKLRPRDRTIILKKVAGLNQKDIAATFGLNQSYISRIETRTIKQIRFYLDSLKNFKGVFSMTIEQDEYKLYFSSKDVRSFNKIFAEFLRNQESVAHLPSFRVECKNGKISIYVLAEDESFNFIAEIIQQIDEFNLKFVSNYKPMSEQSDNSFDKEMCTDKVNGADSNMITHSDTKMDINAKANQNLQKASSKIGPIKEFILSIEHFTVKELREQFPEASVQTINNAVTALKAKEMLISVKKGEYVVKKT